MTLTVAALAGSIRFRAAGPHAEPFAVSPETGRQALITLTETDDVDVVRVSKRLSYVLRHQPDSVGLAPDAAGWVDVDALLAALHLGREQLEHVVATNDKQRFAFDETGTRIRASQGHSRPVDLGYEARQPPDELFHGTVHRVLPAILGHGLRPGRRHAVHLTSDISTARNVGGRRGQPVVLRVDAAAMAAEGHVFTCSPNWVWLTDAVPARFLSVDSGGEPIRHNG